jgi:hypothetical protein
MSKYPILQKEIQKSGIKVSDLREIIGMSEPSYYRKTNGKCEFTLREVLAIKETIKSHLPIEKLFEEG